MKNVGIDIEQDLQSGRVRVSCGFCGAGSEKLSICLNSELYKVDKRRKVMIGISGQRLKMPVTMLIYCNECECDSEIIVGEIDRYFHSFYGLLKKDYSVV